MTSRAPNLTSAPVFHPAMKLSGHPVDSLGKILVIDDNPIIQKTLGLALRYHGYTTLMSSDILDGMRRIRKEQPDLIILDIHFPPSFYSGNGIDGFWLLEWMRYIGLAEGTPVIVISAGKDEGFEARSLDAGAAAFLSKPIKKEALLNEIRCLLDHTLTLPS